MQERIIKIYDSYTKKHWILDPEQLKVSIYCCGPTVYDVCHLGHAKAYINMDMIIRFLQYCGKQVTYVRNITDLDDKIIDIVTQKQCDYEAFIENIISIQEQDFHDLNLLKPQHEPRATKYIPQMLQFIQKLVDQGFTINKHDGVYFQVSKLPEYGQLSGQQNKLHNQRSVRFGLAHNQDFVLWKFAKPNEPYFASVFGAGRPGWHLECSTMLLSLLGQQVDIHAGGCDLLFPHHENELAQSFAHNNCQLAKCWLHFGLVKTKDQQKMSKSLKNSVTVREILKCYHGNHIRLLCLMSNYRSNLVFDWAKLNTCVKVWNKIIDWLQTGHHNKANSELNQNLIDQFNNCMTNNLNLTQVYALITTSIKTLPANDSNVAAIELILSILGFQL